MLFKIPMTNYPNQSFKCTLPVDQKNITFIFNLWYNQYGNYWNLTATNYNTGEVYFSNLPLLYSEGKYVDILGQLRYKGIGSCAVIPTAKTKKSAPDADNLGKAFFVIWGDS